MKRDSGTTPIHLAIVSPCSACKNQLTEPKDGKPACPRRMLEAQKQAIEEQGGSTEHLNHLLLSGTEGTENEGDGSLRNPVYFNDSIFLWVATLSDNSGVRDAEGNLLAPHLLDPAFLQSKTEYIQCRPLPVVPRDHEAAYFQKGAFMEGDQLEVSFTAGQQLEQVSSGTEPVLIDGFAQKVNFLFYHPRTPVEKDLVPAGI